MVVIVVDELLFCCCCLSVWWIKCFMFAGLKCDLLLKVCLFSCFRFVCFVLWGFLRGCVCFKLLDFVWDCFLLFWVLICGLFVFGVLSVSLRWGVLTWFIYCLVWVAWCVLLFRWVLCFCGDCWFVFVSFWFMFGFDFVLWLLIS